MLRASVLRALLYSLSLLAALTLAPSSLADNSEGEGPIRVTYWDKRLTGLLVRVGQSRVHYTRSRRRERHECPEQPP